MIYLSRLIIILLFIFMIGCSENIPKGVKIPIASCPVIAPIELPKLDRLDLYIKPNVDEVIQVPKSKIDYYAYVINQLTLQRRLVLNAFKEQQDVLKTYNTLIDKVNAEQLEAVKVKK